MIVFLLLGYSLVFTGIGLFAEGWRELYKAHQVHRLVTDGLYAYVRHPQYTGLFVALFGEGIVHWPTIFSVAIFIPVRGQWRNLVARSRAGGRL